MIHDEALDQMASAIEQRRLTAPAIMLLEMHKPLVGCLRELYAMAEPLALMLFGSTWSPVVRELLKSPDELERLIERLERSATKPTAPKQITL